MAARGMGIPADPAAAMAVRPGMAHRVPQSSHCAPRTLGNLLSLLGGPVTMPKVPLPTAPYRHRDATAWSHLLHTHTPR